MPLPPAPQGRNSSNPQKGYEPSDVRPIGVGIFGVGLAVGIALTFGAVLLLFRFFNASEPQLDNLRRRQEPAAASVVRAAPDYSGPLLQVAAEEELKAALAAREGELNSYGWIDKKAGTVRIPVDRAIDIIARRGLPPASPGLSLENMQRQRNASQPVRSNPAP